MPYSVRKDSDCPESKPWAVVNDNTHKKMGCHATAEDARAQQKALYAAEPELAKEVDRSLLAQMLDNLATFLKSPKEEDVNFYDDSTLGEKFSILEIPSLAEELSVMTVEDFFAKEQHKRILEVDYPAADFAVVRDPNRPETWGILLAHGAPGNYDHVSLRRAANMLMPGNAAFQAMQLAPEEITSAKRRIRAELQKLGINPQAWPQSLMKEVDDIVVSPDADVAERMRWLVFYSNNALDDDYPADILSARAHKAFAYLANEGVVPMPELRIAHLPHTRLGLADHVDTVDVEDLVFAYATGLVDEGQEQRLVKANEIGLRHASHGADGVLRNAGDKRVVDFYASHEISLLPLDRAANKYTSLVLKGSTMPLSDANKAVLSQLNYGEEELQRIEQALEAIQEGAGKRETKEQSEEQQPPAIETPVETPAYVTRGEIEQLIGSLAQQLNAMGEQIDSLQKSLAEPPAKVETPAEDMTPPASLVDMLGNLLATRPEARLKADAPLAKAAPEETQPSAQRVTGVPFLDAMINGN